MLTPGEPIARTQTEYEFQQSLSRIGPKTYTHTEEEYLETLPPGLKIAYGTFNEAQRTAGRNVYEKNKRLVERYGSSEAFQLYNACQEVKGSEATFRSVLKEQIRFIETLLIDPSDPKLSDPKLYDPRLRKKLEGLSEDTKVGLKKRLEVFKRLADSDGFIFDSNGLPLDIDGAFLRKDYSGAVQAVCTSLESHIAKFGSLFIEATTSYLEFGQFCDHEGITGVLADIKDPLIQPGIVYGPQNLAILPMQRMQKYGLLVREISGRVAGLVDEPAMKKVGEVFVALGEFSIKANEAQRVYDQTKGKEAAEAKKVEQERLANKLVEIFSAAGEEETKEIAEIIKEQTPAFAIFSRAFERLDRKKQAEAIKEIVKAVKTKDGDVIQRALEKHGVIIPKMGRFLGEAIASGYSKYKQDPYYNQINPKIREQIRLAGINAGFGKTAESNFSGHIIGQINIEFGKALDAALKGNRKGMEKSLKEIENYLTRVGFDDPQAKAVCDGIKTSAIMGAIIEKALDSDAYKEAVSLFIANDQRELNSCIKGVESHLRDLGFDENQVKGAHDKIMADANAIKKLLIDEPVQPHKSKGEAPRSSTTQVQATSSPVIPSVGVKVVPPTVLPAPRIEEKPPAPDTRSSHVSPPGVETPMPQSVTKAPLVPVDEPAEDVQGNPLYNTCLELQKTEESFRAGLAVIKEVESEGNKFGNYTSLAEPFNALGQVTSVPFQALRIKEKFLSGDQNTIISGICDELGGLLEIEMPSFISAVASMREIEDLYQQAVVSVNKERIREGKKTIPTSISPTALPMQRIPRYMLLLRDMMKQAPTPANNISPDVLEKLKTTLQKAEEAVSLINQKKREAELKQTEIMFSADKEIQEILIRNGVGKETPLEPKEEEKAKKEIANAIRNGEPEDIKKVLGKYRFSMGADYARPGEVSPALAKAKAIKRDFYCGLIDSRIREKIRETKAPIHAKPSFTTWIRARFRGYTDTTKYIIHRIDKTCNEYYIGKNNPASLKRLDNYLSMLGVDQSAITLVMPPSSPLPPEVMPVPPLAHAEAETSSSFSSLLSELKLVQSQRKQQSDSELPSSPAKVGVDSGFISELKLVQSRRKQQSDSEPPSSPLPLKTSVPQQPPMAGHAPSDQTLSVSSRPLNRSY